MKKSSVIITLSSLSLLLIILTPGAAQRSETAMPPSQVISPTDKNSPELTATLPCPVPTLEPLWVEPVISPTDLLTQTITVWIGNGETVTVTAESGVFTITGDFDVYGNPALVTIDLLPGVTHHLTVTAWVKEVWQNGCKYGGYTRGTQDDRYGQPLTIIQTGEHQIYLPSIKQD